MCVCMNLVLYLFILYIPLPVTQQPYLRYAGYTSRNSWTQSISSNQLRQKSEWGEDQIHIFFLNKGIWIVIDWNDYDSNVWPNINGYVFKCLLFSGRQMILLKKEPANREPFLFESAPRHVSNLCFWWCRSVTENRSILVLCQQLLRELMLLHYITSSKVNLLLTFCLFGISLENCGTPGITE